LKVSLEGLKVTKIENEWKLSVEAARWKHEKLLSFGAGGLILPEEEHVRDTELSKKRFLTLSLFFSLRISQVFYFSWEYQRALYSKEKINGASTNATQGIPCTTRVILPMSFLTRTLFATVVNCIS